MAIVKVARRCPLSEWCHQAEEAGPRCANRTSAILAVETLGNCLAFNFAPPHLDLYVNTIKIESFCYNNEAVGDVVNNNHG